jgi:hypothetical protein
MLFVVPAVAGPNHPAPAALIKPPRRHVALEHPKPKRPRRRANVVEQARADPGTLLMMKLAVRGG